MNIRANKNAAAELEMFKAESLDVLRDVRSKEELSAYLKFILNGLDLSGHDIMHLTSDSQHYGTITTMPGDLIEIYDAESMGEHDIAFECLNTSSTSMYYSDICEYLRKSPIRINSIDKALKPYDLLQDFGINDILCIPVNNVLTKGKTVFSVLAEDISPRKFKNQTLKLRQKLTFLANVVNSQISKIDSLCKDSNMEQSKVLTKRQLDVLEALGRHSMTQQQAARWLGISIRTIETHCEEIKKKLCKSTMPGAVFEAINIGELSLDT